MQGRDRQQGDVPGGDPVAVVLEPNIASRWNRESSNLEAGQERRQQRLEDEEAQVDRKGTRVWSRAAGDVRVVLVTAPSLDVALELARAVVEARLAACVNLIPGVHSVYRWEGEVREDDEVLLVLKTRADRGTALADRIRELHPYDVPEVLELAAVGGSPAYLDWVRAESQP